MAEFRKRGRPRKGITIDLGSPQNQEILHDAAFPSAETIDSEPISSTATADSLANDAADKKRIAAAAKEIPVIFKPEQVEWVFDAYVAILCFTYSIILKTDYSALETELKFDNDEKEMMAKPLAVICSKYCPSQWAGMSAEIQLITSLSIWTVSSFKRAKTVAEKEKEKERDKNRTQAVAPMQRAVTEIHVPS